MPLHGAAVADIAITPQKRTKAFAWMDSDDDSKSSCDGKRSSPSPENEATGDSRNQDGRSGSESGREGKGDAAAAPLRIEALQTFGEFVRATPALRQEVRNISVEQLVALCATAVRLKYFDGDLFREVFKVLTKRFLTNEVDAKAATDIAQHLADLNAYDEKVFSTAIASLEPRVQQLNKEQRLRWLSILEQVNHKSSPSFVDALRAAPVLEDIPIMTSASGKIPCRHFARGFCALGRACTFAHEMGLTPPPMLSPTILTQTQLAMEKRAGPYAGKPPCRHHARGYCALGKNCMFPHIGFDGTVLQEPATVVTATATTSVFGLGPTGVNGGMPIALQAAPAAPPPRPPRPLPLAAKTKFCIHFASGNCTWGSNCNFLHVVPRSSSALP